MREKGRMRAKVVTNQISQKYNKVFEENEKYVQI